MSGPAPEASALARGRVHARLLLALAVLATSVALGVSLPIESGPGAKTPGPWIVVILARLAYRGHAWAVHAFRVLCLVGALLSGAEGISLFSRVPGSSVLLMVSAAVLLAVGLALFAAQEVSAFLTEQRAAHMGSALGQLEARVLHAGDRTAVAAGRGARAAGHAAQQLSGWLSSFPARFAAFRSAAAVRLYVGALIVHPLSLAVSFAFAFLARRGSVPPPYLLIATTISAGFALRASSYARAGLIGTSGCAGLIALARLLLQRYHYESLSSSPAFYSTLVFCLCSFATPLGLMLGRPPTSSPEHALDRKLRAGLGLLVGLLLAALFSPA